MKHVGVYDCGDRIHFAEFHGENCYISTECLDELILKLQAIQYQRATK